MTLFDDWTTRWHAAESDYSVVSSGESKFGGEFIEHDAADDDRRAISWDSVGQAATVEILGLVRLPAFDSDSSGYCRLYVRGAGGTADESAYFYQFNDSTFILSKYESGSASTLASGGTPATDTWYWLRLRVESDGPGANTVKGRHWQYGSSEPGTWNFDVSETSTGVPDSGWVGLGAFADVVQQFDWIGVATGGDSVAVPTTTTATGTGLGDGLSTPTKIKVGVASGSGVATGSASGALFIERTDLVALTEDTILNWPYDFQYFRVKDPHGQYLKAYVTELLEIQNQADAVRDALLIETAPLPELKRLAAEINVNQRAGESVESFRYRTRLNKVNAASNGTAKDIETILGVAFDGKDLRGIDVSHVSGDPIIQFEVPGNFLDDVPISRTDLENLLEDGFACGYGVEVVRSDTWLLGESGSQGIGEGGLI